MNSIHRDDNFHLARKSHNLFLRAGLIQKIRQSLINQNFLEIETPVRVPSPAPEEHIEALPAGDWFLQTSPELCMKRLLAAGYSRIFQFCKCFRADERGARHLPEFTMLEYYIAHCDYHQLMDQCAALLSETFQGMGHTQNIVWQNKTINLAPPWEKITVDDAFLRYAPMSCREALDRDQFDEILTEYIEPHLGVNQPIFLYDYPAPLAALARISNNDKNIAERFELYIGGLEIANGFSELTDAALQRQRFEEALQARASKNWALYALPEKFLQALPKMPEAAGIALGIDRLAMILTGAVVIDDVIAFPPESL